jgi:CRISPR type IV-associated protein Csf3
MVPLKITATLQTPIICDHTLPIDALIYFYAHRDAYGEQVATLPGERNIPKGEHVPLPLLEVNRKDTKQRWYYAASWAQWPEQVAFGTDYWNKRFDANHADLIDFGKRRGKVIVEQGQYKSYHMPVFTRHALSVHWYVVGDGDEIQRLLAHATHIGKKSAQGYGAVLKWSVEAIANDYSRVGDKGQLMRPIPSDNGVLIGYRPSYWLPANQTYCEVPHVQSN